MRVVVTVVFEIKQYYISPRDIFVCCVWFGTVLVLVIGTEGCRCDSDGPVLFFFFSDLSALLWMMSTAVDASVAVAASAAGVAAGVPGRCGIFRERETDVLRALSLLKGSVMSAGTLHRIGPGLCHVVFCRRSC
jgi:hypothetical protein